jgi:hypothetical protein
VTPCNLVKIFNDLEERAVSDLGVREYSSYRWRQQVSQKHGLNLPDFTEHCNILRSHCNENMRSQIMHRDLQACEILTVSSCVSLSDLVVRNCNWPWRPIGL